jgi:hypothetical protein
MHIIMELGIVEQLFKVGLRIFKVPELSSPMHCVTALKMD